MGRAGSCGRALAVALVLAVAGPAIGGSGRLASDGTLIRDTHGRVVWLRGMNYSGLEFGNFFDAVHPPEDADFDQMATWGVDVVRLPIAWNYLEPSPNRIDLDYLRTIVDPVLAFAHRHGIVVVLELHQFQWSPCTGGNGAPAWTCEGQGYSRDALGGWNAEHDFWHGALGPDGRQLLDHFLVVWRALAHHYRRDRRVTAFDMLNEPLDVQALDTFETTTLYPAYRRWVEVVRGEGAPQMLAIEPPVSRNIGIAAHPEPVGDANLLYAPHLYTETAGLPNLQYDGDRSKVEADYALAASEAAAQGGVLWVAEHGGNTTEAGGFLAATELAIHDALDVQDERLVGGAVWAYFPTDNTFSVVDADGVEKGAVVDRLARPYPQATAGTPQSFRFDADSRELSYVFAEDPSRRIPDPTILFVPFDRIYPDGVQVDVSPGDRAVVDVRRSRIVVRRDRGSALHTVHVRPR